MKSVTEMLNEALSQINPAPKPMTNESLLSQLDWQSINAASSSGDGSQGVGEFMWDLQNLQTGDLALKYGTDFADEYVRQSRRGTELTRAQYEQIRQRTDGQRLWDTGTGVASGFVGGLANLGALGIGAFNKDAGTWAADKVQSGMDWVQSNQSDGLNAARELQQRQLALKQNDNRVEMLRNIQNGESDLVAGFRRWGKDTIDSFDSITSRPDTLVQGTSEAIGSLLSGGPIAKGLRTLGTAVGIGARATGAGFGTTRQILKARDWAAWPTAMVGLESGGAYVGTVDEVMSMDINTLRDNPVFQDLTTSTEEGGEGLSETNARKRIANNAGLRAALYTAPIAFGAGQLSRWAETPFKMPSFGSGLANIGKESIEEAIQGTGAGVAQGLAVQDIDPNRDVWEGLGEQTAQGVVYGATAAGVIQGPPTLAQAPGAVLGSTKKFLANRYNSAIERAENESPIGDSKIKEAATEIRTNIAPIAQSLQQVVETSEATPEQKAKETAYISTLSNALSLAPEEIAAIPEAVRTNVDTSGRVEAIRSLGKHMRTLEKGTDEHFAAMAAYLNLLEPIRTIQQVETPLLDQIKEDSPEYATFQNIRQLLSLADKSINARKVVEDAGLLLSSEKVANIVKQFDSVESAKTPEGQQVVQQIAALTSLDPTAGTKETNNFLMKHHEAGNIQLTAPQLAAVQASNALIDAHETFTKEQKAKGLVKAKNFVDEEIVSKNDPLNKKGKYKLSGRQYVNEILQNLMTGNRDYAAEMLEDLGLFAQHMQYKVDALNEHYAAGSAKGNHGLDKIGYTALSPKNFESDARPWYQVPANKGLYVSANNEGSVRSAQSINLEAQTINTLYNNLRTALPELTTADGQPLPEMTFAPLDPAIADGTVQEVVQRHTTKQPAKPQPVKAQEAAPAKQEAAPASEPKKAAEVQAERVEEGTQAEPEESGARPKLTIEQRQERNRARNEEVTNKQWMKGDRQDLRPTDGRARIKVQDTTISYDRTGDQITLNLIHTPQEARGKGSAQAAMQKFLELTDAAGVTVSLSVAEQDVGTQRDGLVRFYNRFGFMGEGDKLTRTPKKEEISEEVLAPFSAPETTDVPLPPTFTTMQERFSTLWNATRNYILTKFRPAVGKDGQPVSRLEGVRNPISWVNLAFFDKESLTEVLGKESKRELTPEITSAYEGILDQTGKYQFTVGGLLRQVNKNLQDFVKTREKWLAKGDAQQAISAKQLNLLEESIDEKGNVTYSYNPELIQSAALAAIQWLLSNNNTNRKLEREEYERIAGYESFTEEVIRFIDSGLPKTQIIPALSNMIRQFWGIQPLADADIAHSNAVIDAVAAELLNAMSELDFVEKKQLKLGEKQNYQGEGRTLENFSIKLHKHSENALGYSVEALKQFTDLIQTVALTNPEPTRYIDGDIPPVADTQMNNPSVRNTPAQRKAIERAQEASASRVDMPMWHITNAFGRDGITDFLSDMDPSWTKDNTNKVHWDTLQAQRLGIQNAFDEVQTTVGEMKNTTSGKSLKDIVVRYAFNFSKVGRLQMLGSYTAQASKFTREVLLPTWSKLNLFDNAGHQQAFALAQMQHLDIKLDKKKVHQVDPSLVPAFIEATYADEKVQPLLKAVRDWMKTADLTSEDPSPKSLDGFKMRALMKDAGFAVTAGALHSVVEWVRYKDANEAGQKDFETSLYLEADGVTNGPIMAMLMLTVGKFDKSWMDAVQKGGIYFGASKPFHQLYTLNNVDLYKQAAQNMESSYKQRRVLFDAQQKDSKKLNDLATDMNTVMSVLFGKDFTYNPVDRTVTFDRGFTKNPLTITLYGSGARGIAGNFVDALLEKLYEMSTQRVNSDIPISPEFEDALDRVLTTNIWYDQDSKTYSVRGKVKQVDFWNKEYSATKQEMGALRNNFLYAIVEPMREAISATVGAGVTNGMSSVQQATQVQSVFVQEMYKNEVEALLEKKKSEPGYRKGDFLSPKELREIDAKVVKAFPNITTRTQIFRVAKNAPLPLSGHGDYARALNDTLYVEPDIKAPAEAGVAGVASVNIGFGDANMIQIAISDPSMGRSLPVFDGWNMPLDAIAHQSEQLNKAVAEAAMGNPLAAIYRSFQKVLENAGDVELSKSALASLARTFESDDLTQDAAIALVETLGARLAQEVKEIDARHKAMKFVGFNVDHMASAGAPHYEGTPNDLTPDQNLELLQAKYEEYLAEPEETANSIVKDAPAAQVYTWDTLKYLVGELKMTGAQKLMYEQVLSAMGAANYTIVAGTREQIHQYMKDNGEDTTNFDETTNGLIHNGKIYLANPTGETLTHELIHAATMNAVIAYYSGQDLGPAGILIQEAIQNLEPMAEDFMTMQVDPNWSLPVLRAFLNARNSMEQQRANGSQAGFIGEFIAWTTTNAALTKTLKTVQPSRVTYWTRSVLGLIKRVLFGKKKMPEVAEDFLSNVQFNASILVQAQITLPEVYEQLTLKHATSDSKLERIRDGFNNWVVRNLKPNPMHRAQVRDVQQSVAAEELANYAGDTFGLGQLEKDTLREVMAALATEASIDPQATIGIQEMYRLAQESLDPSDFVDENSLNLDADTTKAQWKFQLLMGKRDRFYDTSNRSDLLPLFLGLALVSPEVQGVLAKIKIPGKKKGAKTVDQGLENLASNMMRSLSGRLTSQGNSQNVQQALDNMTENLLRNIAKTKTNMDVVEARVDQGLRANEFVKNQLQNLSTAGVKYGKKLETSQNKLTRTTGKLIRFSAAMASETEADKAADGVLQFVSAIDLNNTMMSLAKDLIGRTAAIGDVYDRIKQTRAMTQQMRQNFRDRVPEVILKKFKTKPTDKQMATMFKGFAMTDLVALGEDTKMLNDLLTDPSKVKARIKELEDSIKSRDPKHWSKLNDKMQQLAQFMMTKRSGAALLRNAYAIANLWAVPGTGNRPQPSETMIAEIDQLTSLYALERLSQEERDTLASLVQNETEGVDFMLSYLVGQRKTESVRNKLGNARANHYKGFVPSLPTNGGQIIVDDDANFVERKHQGFTRIGTYNGHGNTSRGYYYTSTPTQAAFAQGMMQNINQTAGGVERSTGFSTSPVANRITNRRMVRSLIGRMQAESRMTENLSPIFNDRGVIIAFEQLMDPAMLEMVKPSTELHKMLGVWRGRQVEELQATKVNMALMDTLKTNYDEADDQGLYVNILDRKNLDRVEADAIRLFSEETLEYAEKVFGKNRIMVRRDLIDDVIGYRNFSVSDFWTDNNRFREDTNKAIRQAIIGFIGSDAYKVLVKSEQFVQGLVSDARTQIVVKSVIVPAINIAGNMLHLMQRGVNPIMMAREFPKKLNELNTYLRTYLEQVELEAELRAATKPTHITQIQAKIRSIKDAHRRLTIWPLIEAGEFSSIADIGNSREDLKLSSGRLNEWIGKQIDKLPQEARTLAKYGLVTKDTALFQGLQKSVQYGDFLAKAILYDHMLVKENRTREQALAQLTEEFVNYDRLPGRMRGGLENLGLLWFYNFKLRSLKVGLSIMRNNPLHAAMSMVIPTPFGIDTAVDANIAVKAMGGALPYSLGPGMGLRAITLNPWVNLVN